MDLDQLGQAGDLKVPFAGEAVAPASVFHGGAEAFGHQLDDLAGAGAGEEIEVAAEIGPVIEGLDDATTEAHFFEGLGDGGEEGKCIADAALLDGESIDGPLGAQIVAHVAGEREEDFHAAHDDVVEMGEMKQVVELFSGKPAQVAMEFFAHG